MRTPPDRRSTLPSLALSGAGLAFVLFVYGAVPFVALPTLGQVVWSSGFSQSFANQSLMSPYAHNFGLPVPAPMVFGLSGAYPMGLLILCGFHPADAYSAVAALWLSLAYVGARAIGLSFGLREPTPTLGAMAWMTLPVVWGHAYYSMLSFNIALLPCYLYLAIRLFQAPARAPLGLVRVASTYVLGCLIAVFMDGYVFVMFAIGATLLGGFVFLRHKPLRRHCLTVGLPVHAAGFALAYALYALYVGKMEFEPAPIDLFRGFGVDLAFITVPSRGISWLWDALGLSTYRSRRQWFGDWSVWTTTFSLPLIVLGLLAWSKARQHTHLATGLLVVALFALYMSLGPSLKVHSTRPESMLAAGILGESMPAHLAVGPTGSAFLSSTVPGLRSMRASYRWLALALACFWMLSMLALALLGSRRTRSWGMLLLIFILLSNLPHLGRRWSRYVVNRTNFLSIDDQLVSDMKKVLSRGERTVFLPVRNDFLANYLSSRAGFETYNVGGDKNLALARAHWPATMRLFQRDRIGANFSQGILLMLGRREADAIVLPYIDLQWAAYYWPPPPRHKWGRHKAEIDAVALELRSRFSRIVQVEERPYYLVVRLREGVQADALVHAIKRGWCGARSCLRRSWASLESLPSEVGRLRGRYLESKRETGFLVSGPHVAMNAGTYRLIVEGVASSAVGAWVDVASHSGAMEHARFPLAQTRGSHGVIAAGQVVLQNAVDDLEVRIFVSAADEVALSGYELRAENDP